MMFSSNQVLEISGDLSHKGDLKQALEFALIKSGREEYFKRADNPAKLCYQKTDYGDFAIGYCWENQVSTTKDWIPFQFDYDLDITAKIISQHLEKQNVEAYSGDGSNYKGYLMKAIDYTTTRVKDTFYGIVIFHPFNCYYDK